MKRLALIIGILSLLTGLAAIIFIQNRQSNPISNEPATKDAAGIQYIALGDSYTIGQNVAEANRWPNQLVKLLQQDGIAISIQKNPSVTGYTTQDLIDHELGLVKTLKPDFVTIQIGVNDYVQGVPQSKFETNFEFILDETLRYMESKQVVVVTIPDYAKTPAGAQFGDTEAATATILKMNEFIKQSSMERGITTVDIFAISQRVSEDPDLVANDDLHPSGKQYALWAEVIFRAIKYNGLL